MTAVEVGGRRLHVVDAGAAGPRVLLLHGYPASSLEHDLLVPLLAPHARVRSVDLLGFGASDKPPRHRYSIAEQADLVTALVAGWPVDAVVAGDYGALVVQELLARREEGRPAPELPAAVLTNASLWVELYRPTRAQRLARMPLGGLLARFASPEGFARSWGGVFGPRRPLDAPTARRHWDALLTGTDRTQLRRLLSYIPEREREHVRWEAALTPTPTALRFLWSDADPVSGRQVADAVAERLPGRPLRRLPDVGHVVAMEAPEELAAEVRAALRHP